MAIFQQQPIVTDRPFVALQNHSQHVPPYQFQRGGGGEGGEGAPPPPLKSIPFQLKSIPWGGGGHIDSINLFGGGGGGGGGGGWRALSFDKSILSRGQINFQPTPIFVNKNSSFALPELAFVTFTFEPPSPFVVALLLHKGITKRPGAIGQANMSGTTQTLLKSWSPRGSRKTQDFRRPLTQ